MTIPSLNVYKDNRGIHQEFLTDPLSRLSTFDNMIDGQKMKAMNETMTDADSAVKWAAPSHLSRGET